MSLFILVFVTSGIIMNHRSLFSGIDIDRKFLLPEYRYEKWNNAAIRGACELGGDSILVYGNVGVWITDTIFSGFSDFNKGFPDGVDNRKIFKVIKTGKGELLAGTLFGPYRYDQVEGEWSPVAMPGPDRQVVDLINRGKEVLLMTRSGIYRVEGECKTPVFHEVALPAPAGYLDKVSLFKTLWVIHSGEIAGSAGKLFVDLMGVLLAFLTLTGIVYWLFPKWMKYRKAIQKGVSLIRRTMQFSIKWHNRIGAWAVVFLLLTVITGMFLRPPLLIPIAGTRVDKIPFTVLDDENPWYDQLRRLMHDPATGGFLIGTNRGIYYADDSFEKELLPFHRQPPLSVMGINVFDRTDEGDYLVGSFNGLFLWNPYQGWLIDFFSPGKAVIANPSGPPLGENMIAGAIRVGRQNFYAFDYNKGVIAAPGSRTFPAMPTEMLEKSPMSLWNLALEFHTGRYYSFLLGQFYILFIPMFGILMIVILVTGTWLWYGKRKKERNTYLETL